MAYQQTNGYAGRNPAGAGATNNAPPLNGNAKYNSLIDASQTPLPPSSPAIRSPRPELGGRTMSTPRPSPNPQLRRASSSLSLQSNDRRSSSPALFRKSSTSSLRGDANGPSTPSRLNKRASSSQLAPHSPLAPQMEEPPITENSIAEDWFKEELTRHESPDMDNSVNTVVILHEACYGHRFARPKTTKTTLGLIVERPERIEASTMGISAAYVRLGERHNEGQYAPDPRVRPPPHLPFKIRRTDRIVSIDSPAVTAVHGTKWMDELKVMTGAAAEKLASTGRETERPNDPLNKNKPAFHSGDLYLCSESRAAFEGALGGVCEGVDAVFSGNGAGPSQAFVCIRPPGHHCSADFPSGFCWLNNVHVGIQHAVKEHSLTHATIIDFDLHHGDGSQAIAWEHNQKVAAMPKNTPTLKKTAIGYYSIHDINSYPCENGDSDKILNASICLENAHNQSIWNVHLQPWNSEQEFWELYETKYNIILEKARIFLKHHTQRLRGIVNGPKPKGAIFISAGFDASEHEDAGMQRHSVNVPTEFYARFTRDIVQLAQEEGTGVDGRVISVLEGGYSDKALISGVLSHVSGLCHGQHVAATPVPKLTGDGLADEMARLNMGGLSGIPQAGNLADIEDIALQLRYNPEWWTSSHLDALVEILNPAPSMPAFEAVKAGRTSNFASPTAASKMKIVDPSLQRRTSRHFDRFPGAGSVSPSRPATPPPPAVHWTVAAQELCKLLIPNRQTKSHTAAELAAPKVKKERQSAIGLQTVPAGPRELRAKRGAVVKPSPPIPEAAEAKRVVSSNDPSRRRTIAANEIANPGPSNALNRSVVADRTRRRSSVASTISNISAAPSTATATAAPRPKPVTNGSGSGVTVKKARPAVSKTPVPTASTTTARAPSMSAARGPSRTPSISTASGTDGAMDSLVAKTQKLKINMPSNEEYVARQKARAGSATPAAAKPTTTSTMKKPAEPRKVGRPAKAAGSTAAAAKKPALSSAAAKAKSPTADLTPEIPGTGAFQVDAASAGASAAPNATTFDGMQGQYQLEPPAAPPSMTSATTLSDHGASLSSPAEPAFPSYGNAMGVPIAPAPITDHQVAAAGGLWQPTQPAMNAPPPVWNSTGPIPFAPPTPKKEMHEGVVPSVEVKKEETGPTRSIWDVPDTPAK